MIKALKNLCHILVNLEYQVKVKTFRARCDVFSRLCGKRRRGTWEDYRPFGGPFRSHCKHNSVMRGGVKWLQRFFWKENAMPIKVGRSCQACCAKCVQILTTHFSVNFGRADQVPKPNVLSLGTSGSWQLMSVNFNRRMSSSAAQVVDRLMRPAFTCPNLPLVFALQETTSWDIENYVCSLFRICLVAREGPRLLSFQFNLQCKEILVSRWEKCTWF